MIMMIIIIMIMMLIVVLVMIMVIEMMLGLMIVIDSDYNHGCDDVIDFDVDGHENNFLKEVSLFLRLFNNTVEKRACQKFAKITTVT